jgi:lysine-specific demethylase 3
MDHARSNNIDENVGIPEDLRCKRSDGKQWRCTALSMPDKTVCEKHYFQAKKRAANSAMRANLKKSKPDSDVYLESKSDDFDASLSTTIINNRSSSSSSGKKLFDKVSKNQFRYTPEGLIGSSAGGNTSKLSGGDGDVSPDGVDDEDAIMLEENWVSNDEPAGSGDDDSAGKMMRTSLDGNAATVSFVWLVWLGNERFCYVVELKGWLL